MRFTTIFSMVIFVYSAMAQPSDYQPLRLSQPDSWSLVILPDPQSYVKYERNQGIFDIMTAWIAENQAQLNIQMVLCTGDLVEQNNILKGDGKNGNQSSLNQWRAIDRSISRLDHVVPYVLAAGNHDFGYKNIENRHSFYNKYITADRNPLNENRLQEYFYSTDGMPTLANAAFEWIDPNNIPYLFLNLEFAPRNAVIEWAKEVVDREKYQDHRVIVLTHSYMDAKNKRRVSESYPVTDGNYGEAMWQKLIYPADNIVMVIAGHIGKPNDMKGHTAFAQEKNHKGRQVTQMVFNAQALGGGWQGNGGDGWLRCLEFLPDGQTVRVNTYSPYFGLSPSTQHLAHDTASYSQFSFRIE